MNPMDALNKAEAIESQLEVGNVATESQPVASESQEKTERKRGRPPKNPEAPVASSAELSRLEQMEKELNATKERLAAKEAELEAERNRSGVRPSEKVTVGDGYRFRVQPINPEHAKNVNEATKEIVCCDESEAKRWYCVTTKDPETEKAWDPVAKELRVECLDQDRRAKVVARRKYEQYVLAKGEAMQPLTDAEREVYERLKGFADYAG